MDRVVTIIFFQIPKFFKIQESRCQKAAKGKRKIKIMQATGQLNSNIDEVEYVHNFTRYASLRHCKSLRMKQNAKISTSHEWVMMFSLKIKFKFQRISSTDRIRSVNVQNFSRIQSKSKESMNELWCPVSKSNSSFNFKQV